MKKEKELVGHLKKYYYLTGTMPSKRMRRLMKGLEKGEIIIIHKKEIEQIKRIVEYMGIK